MEPKKILIFSFADGWGISAELEGKDRYRVA